jgi:hypothetical protein
LSYEVLIGEDHFWMKWKGLAGGVAIVMLGSVATAEDRATLLQTYTACNIAAARALASKEGHPLALALKARSRCKTDGEALLAELGPEGMMEALSKTLAYDAGAIQEERQLLEQGASRLQQGTYQGRRIYCSACGMRPTWDDRLKIWRPYGR